MCAARHQDRAGRAPRDASRRYHDRVARQYDAIYDDPYWDFHDELTWRMVKPHLPRDAMAACADLGCGTGKWGLKLLKSGFATTFVDNAAAMIEQARAKVQAMGPRAKKATLLVADIVDLAAIPSESLSLTLAMGDPLSICADPQAAAREMARTTRPGGVVIATADNKLAALDHFVTRGNLDALEAFVRTGRTNWLTADDRERFELTTFTPASLRKLFERVGFEVLEVTGKPVIPVRQNKHLLLDESSVRRLLALETELARDPASAGRAAHLQVVARRVGTQPDIESPTERSETVEAASELPACPAPSSPRVRCEGWERRDSHPVVAQRTGWKPTSRGNSRVLKPPPQRLPT